MILVLSIGLAIAIGLVTGGSLGRLARISFKLGWLTFVALGIQIGAVYVREPAWLASTLLIISYLLLVAVILANLRLPGLAALGLGLLANMATITANGGYMPVTPEAVARAGLQELVTVTDAGVRVFGSKDIVLSAADTRLWILSDILVLKHPFSTILSIGDLLLAVGAFWFIYAALYAGRRAELEGRVHSMDRESDPASHSSRNDKGE